MKKYKLCFLLAAALIFTGCTQNSSVDDTSSSIESISESDEETGAETGTESEAETSETGDEASSEETSQEEAALEETSEVSEAETESISEEAAESSEEVSDTATESETEEIIFYSCDEIMYLTSNANIRLSPSLDSTIYCIIPAGTAVQIVAISDDWAVISITGDGTYYVSTTLLTTENPAEETAAEATTETTTTSSQSTNNTSTGILYDIGDGSLVCIDAGHQAYGNSDTEPNAPDSTVMKAKVTTGTSGVATGLAESVLNLTVSCMLRDELLARGYNVLMIRESQDVDISNAERAMIANNAGADVFIRIHANGSSDQSLSGALTMCPTASNPYVGSIYSSCRSLSEYVVNGLCAATGAVNRGVQETDTMTGINWCTVPVTIVEMGFMSNPTEDTLMSTTEYQTQIVTGIANGIDAYFVSIGMR